MYGLNNLNNIFYLSSTIITKLIIKLKKNLSPPINYYGHSKDLLDVNDNYPIWDKYFGKNHDHIKDPKLLDEKSIN